MKPKNLSSPKPHASSGTTGLLRTTCVMRLLLLVLLMLPAVVQAQFDYTTQNGTITITGYTGPGGAVAIPATINGLPVTSIGGYAFRNRTSLTSITVPSSITNIGSWAFEGCTGLVTMTIGSGVTSMGDIVCSRCTSLTAITVDADNSIYGSVDGVLVNKSQTILLRFPQGKTGNYAIPSSITSIKRSAFESCTSLTSITIPDSVTDIGGGVFNGCTSLTSVTIGSGVTNIGSGAFRYCTSLTEITIPAKVTSIGQAAFTNCTSLVTLKLGSGVTNMGDNVCSGCTSLTNINVDADNSIYASVDGILVNKSQTTLIRFPQGKTGNYTIPSSVTSIGRWAFQYCTGLTGVTIPSNVTSIRENGFSDFISLKGVYFLGRAPRFGSGILGGDSTATVYYLPGTAGWGPTFGGRPTAPWLLPNPLILKNGPRFGVRTNQFGFVISWATNASVVVEASADLAQPIWTPVGTNTLTDGSSYFSDPQWMNYPARFYRLRSP